MTNTEAQAVLGNMLMRYDLTDAELEAIGMAGEALEETIAPIHLLIKVKDTGEETERWQCPGCKKIYRYPYNYCPNCGQRWYGEDKSCLH